LARGWQEGTSSLTREKMDIEACQAKAQLIAPINRAECSALLLNEDLGGKEEKSSSYE